MGKTLTLALWALAAAHAAGPAIRVTETAGLARKAEPVVVNIGGKEQVLFVTIGARQTRTFPIGDLKPPEPITFEQHDPVGFQFENSLLAANHGKRTVNGAEEDSGTLRGLTFKPAGVTLQRTQNRMHWAPSFQRTGAKGYTSIAMWTPVQKVDRQFGEGWYVHRREGHHALYPEINLRAEYRYFAGVPYFLFHATMTFASAIDMFWLRAQEMTMDDLFTHVAWPDQNGGAPRIYDFEARKPVLEKSPIPVDVPWVAFVNLDKGYGFGAVVLDYKATRTAGAFTSINDGANNGKYWDRHLVSRISTMLVPGDRYEERTAYVLFQTTRDQPVAEFLEWEKRLRAPLVARVARPLR